MKGQLKNILEDGKISNSVIKFLTYCKLRDTYKLLILFMLATSQLFSQGYEGGLIFSAVGNIAKEENYKTYYLADKNSVKSVETNDEQKILILGFDISYSAKLSLSEKIQFELRPGILISDEIFWALHGGAFLRYNIDNDWFVVSGLLSELHTGGGNSYSSFDFPIYGSLQFGKRIFNKVKVLIGVNKTLGHYYASKSMTFSNPSKLSLYSSIVQIKTGIEFTF